MTTHFDRDLNHSTQKIVRQPEGNLCEGSIEQRADDLSRYVKTLITAIERIDSYDRDCLPWVKLQIRADGHSGIRPEVEPFSEHLFFYKPLTDD